jgi:hypothetical protein
VNNTYVSKADRTFASTLNRRAFLIGVGSVTALVSACGVQQGSQALDPTASEIQKIVWAKEALISDAIGLITSDATLSAPLQVVIDQNRLHIEALSRYLTVSASPSALTSQGVDLPALTTRCAVFSTNNMELACKLVDAELSRTVALIAASEMQHFTLLSGYIA